QKGEMPPEEEEPRPSKADVAVLRDWIKEGAADFNSAPRERPFITPADLLQFVRADLHKAAPREQKFRRYFTITHLYNAGLPEDSLQSYRLGLSKLVNSLSWGRKIIPPTAIDPARTAFRIDLREYQWNADVWKGILAHYPFGVLPAKAADGDIRA